MKKKIILLPLVGILVYVIMSGNSSGPGYSGMERTGATGTAGCYTGSTCHNTSASSSTTIAIELDSAGVPVSKYVAGGSYSIKMTGVNTSSTATTLSRFGFQVAVTKLTGWHTTGATNAGVLLAPTGTHTITPTGVSVTVVEHSSPIAATTLVGSGGSGTTYVMNVPWTAPATGTGGVYIDAVINAVNYDGSATTGDLWNYTNSSLITEEVAPITGTATVCVGSSTVLSDATPSGTWSSGSTGVATVSGGTVYGVSPGTSVISYATSLGTATRTVTVSASSTSITGTLSLCQGASTALGLSPGTLGTWVSGSTGVATVNTLTGAVGGVVTGSTTPATAVITFTPASGCPVSVTVTVNPTPSAITGTAAICAGATTTLNSTPSGGTWSSAATGIATVDPSTGVVTGVVTGSSTLATAVITYMLTGGCSKTMTVTVNPTPAAITGSAAVCVSSTTVLSESVTGGVWTSGSTGIATVTSGGTVTGVGSGTATISYSIGTCIATRVVTVSTSAPPITGSLGVCVSGGTSPLGNAIGGGTWTSSNPSAASIGSGSGIVTGGPTVGLTTTITYTTPSGCTTTAVVTVNAVPSPITGVTSVCSGGATTTLSSLTPGGTWSSNNSAIASVGVASSGIITGGLTSGTATISYTVGGCATTTPVTVNTSPVISGSSTVCSGTTTTLTATPAGGTWTSGNISVASIGLSSGVLNAGTVTGTTGITYAAANGCLATSFVTVNPVPGGITGNSSICPGSLNTLGALPPGGTWTSSNTAVASIGATSGILIGGSVAGTTLITYNLAGCTATATVTLNPSVLPITGNLNACVGATSALGDGTVGGTWSSSNSLIASVNPGGVVMGVDVGTADISYTAAGCSAIATVTVNPAPANITGPAIVCAGTTATLTDGSPGGTWTSSNTTVGTIGLTTGVLTGGTTPGGITNITYILPTGCSTVTAVTVTPLPSGITGGTNVCSGSAITLSNSIPGGTWTSGNIVIASIGLTSGVLTGGNGVSGTANITYTLSAGCVASTTITVNPLPAPITGIASVCIGMTSNLADAGGGTWSSGSTAIATVGSTGIVNGVSAGTATITYTLPTTCAITRDVTVNPLPTGIGGPGAVCRGSVATLNNGTPGGTWSSSNITLATIDLLTGDLSAVAAGNPVITYTLGAGCFATTVFTVNPLFPIGGPSSICAGLTATLTDLAAGGTWSSSNGAAATIVTGTGFVTGVAPGTTLITYTTPAGCTISTSLNVVSSPSGIGGDPNVCIGSTSVLSNSGGGTWTSSDLSKATVNGTGVVSGVATGTATITYSLGTGCAVTLPITVNALPGAITGTTQVCLGANSTLASSPAGGTWSSNNTNASVDLSTGTITGDAAGTSVITYTSTVGCIRTIPVTVNALPAPIAGNTSMCIGASTTLSDAAGAGTWSSDNTAIATVTSGTGIVHGIDLGTANITYTAASTGCAIAAPVMVNSLPSAIGGSSNVCVGSSITLTDSSSGGSWTSGSAGIASIDISSGQVSGLTSGISNITYSLGVGCNVFKSVTVNALPALIGGPHSVCIGSVVSLTNSTPGGVWSSSNNTLATVGLSTGAVSGLSQGIDTISYIILGTGCLRTTTMTVNPTPAGITGTTAMCLGGSTNLSDATPGGTWTSGATAVATVNNSGAVTSVSAGTANITYALATGCRAVATVIVNPLPALITGNTTVCTGAATLLSDILTGGTWSNGGSGNTSVGAGTGVVTGISAGTDIITYTIGTGCSRTTTVTINNAPAGISGTAAMCAGSALPLADATPGGTWSSGTPSVAVVGSLTGIVSGIAPSGISTITYKIPNGCTAGVVVTVNPLPSVIGGGTNVCTGSTTLLTNALAGGTWTSAFTGIATVGFGSGVLGGVAAGTSVITYTLPTGCKTTGIVTVNPTPLAITGGGNICSGTTISLVGPTGGGTWSSSPTSVATVGLATGIVSGVSAGTATIAYTLSTGCNTTTTIIVNPSPSAISGTTHVCSGQTTTLVNAVGGGSWSSSNPSVASVGAGTGVVTGSLASTVTITYSLSAGCSASTLFVVNPLPAPVTGATVACAGATTTLSNIITGGSWSSGTSGVATVGAGTGTVVGVSAGTAGITYTLPTGCLMSTTVTINPAPVAITGAGAVCAGSSITLSDAVPGGTWSSGTTAVATVNVGTGTVTGASAGTTVITYALPSGCIAITGVNVNPLPLPIKGTKSACTGATTTLTDDNAGGTWSTGNVAVAFINPSGVVTGMSAGFSAVTYTMPTGCIAVANLTVNQSPAAISGTPEVCVGGITDLDNPTPGGTWSSSNPAIASVDAGNGVVTGITQGIATISYKLASGCSATIIVSDQCNVGVTQITPADNEMVIFPNPNKGEFMISGSLTNTGNDEVFVSVSDMLGKIVFKDILLVKNGKLNHRIMLGNNLPNGMYLLTLNSGNEHRVLHFVIE